MAEVTAQMVKELRERTGAGMMDCKNALNDCKGEMEAAVDALRKKGLAAAAKKAGRVTAEGAVGSYIHGGGKIGVLVEVNCETDFVARTAEFQELIHDIALHIAFANPDYISRDEVPKEVVAKETAFFERQAADSGKPANIIPKIVEGQINAFFKGICLLDQPFVRDDKQTVGDLVTAAGAKLGEKVDVRRFTRYDVGKE